MKSLRSLLLAFSNTENGEERNIKIIVDNYVKIDYTIQVAKELVWQKLA